MDANIPAVPESKVSKWHNTEQWRDLRRQVLARDPICRLCDAKASTTIDDTPEGLCQPCSDAKPKKK
jgi:hypothetical protein